MPTIEQIRAARALIGWSQGDLANQSGLSQTGIARIENGTNQPNSNTIEKIKSAFDRAGIEFIESSGVKKRTSEIRSLQSQQGFTEFMNDVYETVKEKGGDICVSNVDERNWIKWMTEDNYLKHSEKMKELANFCFKIFIEEGDQYHIANRFAEYRYTPKEFFTQQSFYTYGNKLALLEFSEENVEIRIIKNPEWAQSFRSFFNFAWNMAGEK